MGVSSSAYGADQQSPPQLPPLVRGQQIRNGPYVTTVTDSMVAERERQNREIRRRWELDNQRRQQQITTMQGGNENWSEDFKDAKVRRRFVRRVFGILSVQLMFTALVVATFVFVEEAREFVLDNLYLWPLALIAYMVSLCSISCSDCARRQPPCNVICLSLLTLSLSMLAAFGSMLYTPEAVLISICSTAIVTTVIFFTAACCKFDLTKYVGLLLILSVVTLCIMLGLIITRFFIKINNFHLMISMLGTLLISVYLFFDVQTLMGGREIQLSPDEVVYATAQLYVDIVLLYKYILMFTGNYNN
ncbi:hypothetical protein QAD02_009993 [Eretmocerus hayati]|uniref:Uncharacterized protein n=1 Tax=Eretmocerus hayati TaxID=131215 RepID=A0ACC2NAZ8_9HYME|nr:hypothetical protein QAD02_009993 [Eretmocerus hayati]